MEFLDDAEETFANALVVLKVRFTPLILCLTSFRMCILKDDYCYFRICSV